LRGVGVIDGVDVAVGVGVGPVAVALAVGDDRGVTVPDGVAVDVGVFDGEGDADALGVVRGDGLPPAVPSAAAVLVAARAVAEPAAAAVWMAAFNRTPRRATGRNTAAAGLGSGWSEDQGKCTFACRVDPSAA